MILTSSLAGELAEDVHDTTGDRAVGTREEEIQDNSPLSSPLTQVTLF